MIVKCTDCESSYVVDDTKVSNKKFGFTCPKCGTSVIIDNRVMGKAPEESFPGDDFLQEDLPPKKAFPRGKKSEEDLLSAEMDSFLDDFEEPKKDTPGKEKSEASVPTDDELMSVLDEMDDQIKGPGKKKEELSMEEDFNLPEMEKDDMGDLTLDDIPVVQPKKTIPTAGKSGELSGLDVTDTELKDLEEDETLSIDDFEFSDEIKEAGKGKPVDAVGHEEEDLVLVGAREKETVDLSDELNAEIGDFDLPAPGPSSGKTLGVSSGKGKAPDDFTDMDFFETPARDEKKKPAETEDFTPLEEDLVLDDALLEEAAEDKSKEEPLAFEDFDKPAVEKVTSEDFDMLEAEVSDLSMEEPLKEEKSPLKGVQEEEDLDESITIDLDSLDIQLEEEPAIKAEVEEVTGDEFISFSDETDLETEPDRTGKKLAAAPSDEEMDDENITIDLDTLDIPLEEAEEFKEGESLDEDERITIEDAGLTIDELSSEKEEWEAKKTVDEESEEDLKLSIDDIDPSISIDELASEEAPEDLLLNAGPEEKERLISEEIASEDLPEIDLDRFQEEESSTDKTAELGILAGTAAVGGVAAAALLHKEKGKTDVKGMEVESKKAEDYLDIEAKEDFDRYRNDIEKTSVEAPADVVPGGAINFSIDYSLKYSRLGAVLRLFGLFYFALIPYYIVMLIYFLLSQILGALNWCVILFAGQNMDDFTEIQENTLRFMLSLNACGNDVVEEMPVYAGRKDIDHPVQ